MAKLAPDGKSLVYSTYLGGSSCITPGFCGDAGLGIAVDSAGSAYVAGSTGSPDFPTTPGAFQAGSGGNLYTDGFVTKLAPDGKSLVYSTYLGGSVIDSASGIAVDSALSAYVTGQTQSPDFPTTPGVFQPAILDDQSAFVSKLAPDGKSLIYSSFLGGTGSEYDHPCGICIPRVEFGKGIVVDSAFNAYVTGSTNLATFPTTGNAFQGTFGGGGDADENDAFLTEINAGGTALLYSTFLGGSVDDDGFGIALDPSASGNVYVTGYTESVNFPIVNAVQLVCAGCQETGPGDAFVARIDTTQSGANSLLFSSFLGGADVSSVAHGIAVGVDGNAYAAGFTGAYFPITPASFPITPGAFQVSPGENPDGFVVKIGPNSAPGFTIAPGSLDFGNENVATTTPLALSVWNAGTTTLNISSITLTGTNSGEFSESDTCGGSVLPAGGSCGVTVRFMPVTVGTKTAVINFSDNAASSPQGVSLSGNGADFSFGAASGANCPTSGNCSTSATITAGGTATYNLQVSPLGGFNGTVALGCSGAPSPSICSVSPASVPPNGTSNYAFTVTVDNTSGVAATPLRLPRGPMSPRDWPIGLLLLAVVPAPVLFSRSPFLVRQRRYALVSALGLLLFSLAYIAGCGGSSGANNQQPVNATLTVTGTSSSLSRTASLSLTVNP